MERSNSMIIKTDEEGQKAILQLCDIALKSMGMSGLQGIQLIIQSIESIKGVNNASTDSD